MSKISLTKGLSIVIFFSVFLTACGGGGGGSEASSSPVAKPNAAPPKTDNAAPNAHPPVTAAPTISDNAQAALIADNEFSIARTSCGLSGLQRDQALADIAQKHSHYIKHVFANSTPTVFNPHYENKISNIAELTAQNNPFFGGTTFSDRLDNANYANLKYGVTENIAQTIYYSSVGTIVSADSAASSMAKSLLAAPYHLRSLMRPSSKLVGTEIVSYKPFDRDPKNNQGYVLVTHAAAAAASANATPQGIFTYPCQGVQGTVTGLYNESPNPVQGTGRDLRVDPIGQPIYVSVPTAKSIKVSNIKFYDSKRQIVVPVSLLDYDNDPHKATANKLPNNEAFILPLTDNLQSCELGRKKGGNCGLYGNSEYRVSFDVLVDNKDLQSKSFSFTTGAVNY